MVTYILRYLHEILLETPLDRMDVPSMLEDNRTKLRLRMATLSGQYLRQIFLPSPISAYSVKVTYFEAYITLPYGKV